MNVETQKQNGYENVLAVIIGILLLKLRKKHQIEIKKQNEKQEKYLI